MILTGKAKEDFKEWLYKKYDILFDLEEYHKTMLCAEIIEWLDSVGIYISIITQENDKKEIRFTSDINEQNFISCETRKQATEEAIKKANEIYNKN